MTHLYRGKKRTCSNSGDYWFVSVLENLEARSGQNTVWLLPSNQCFDFRESFPGLTKLFFSVSSG